MPYLLWFSPHMTPECEAFYGGGATLPYGCAYVLGEVESGSFESLYLLSMCKSLCGDLVQSTSHSIS